jgi:Lar family restriction alleviation protein
MNDKTLDADRVIAGWQETIREVEANKDGFVEIPRKRIVTTPTQAMDDKTLLPCPFCGGVPKSYWQGDSIDQDCGYWAVECCHIHVHTDDEAEAIAAWNTRAPQATRIEALEADNARARAQGQDEGFAAAVQELRDMSARKPLPTLWHAASVLADSLEQSRIPCQALESKP